MTRSAVSKKHARVVFYSFSFCNKALFVGLLSLMSWRSFASSFALFLSVLCSGRIEKVPKCNHTAERLRLMHRHGMRSARTSVWGGKQSSIFGIAAHPAPSLDNVEPFNCYSIFRDIS